MATVTGMTAARMLEIEQQSITDARIEGDELILTTFGGTDQNVGSVRGPQGIQGPGGTVTTVNGKTGSSISLTAADVGAVTPAQAASLGVPVGTIVATVGTAAQAGYMICDGRSINRADYPALFALISTRYGSTSSTTFNIPDFRGRTPVGLYSADTDYDTLGEKGGSKTAKLTVDNMPAHKHSIDSSTTRATKTQSAWKTGAPGETGSNGGKSMASGWSSGRYGDDVQINGDTNSVGKGTAFDIVQPYQVVNFMIKTS